MTHQFRHDAFAKINTFQFAYKVMFQKLLWQYTFIIVVKDTGYVLLYQMSFSLFSAVDLSVVFDYQNRACLWNNTFSSPLYQWLSEYDNTKEHFDTIKTLPCTTSNNSNYSWLYSDFWMLITYREALLQRNFFKGQFCKINFWYTANNVDKDNLMYLSWAI